MSRMDRYRLSKKYSDSLSGDAETTKLATGGLAELLKSAGEAGAAYQTSQAEKTKQQDLAAAKSARSDADDAATAAASETDKNGPLHARARQLDAGAKALEKKMSQKYSDVSMTKSSDKSVSKSSSGGGMPKWGVYALVAGGVGVAGLLVYKLFSKKGRR